MLAEQAKLLTGVVELARKLFDHKHIAQQIHSASSTAKILHLVYCPSQRIPFTLSHSFLHDPK